MTEKEELELRKKKLELEIAIAEQEAVGIVDNQDPMRLEEYPKDFSAADKLALGFGNTAGLKKKYEDIRKSPDGLWEIKKNGVWHQEPTGPGLSDIGPALPAIGGTVGSILGGLASAPAAGTTLVPQAIAGGALGSGMGATLRHTLGAGLGLTEDNTQEAMQDIALQTALGGASEFAGPLVGKALGGLARNVAAPMLSGASGVPTDSILYAMTRPKDFLLPAQRGIVQDLLSSSVEKQAGLSAGYDAKLKQIMQKYGQDPANKEIIENILMPYIQGAEKKKLSRSERNFIERLLNNENELFKQKVPVFSPASTQTKEMVEQAASPYTAQAPVFSSQVDPSVGVPSQVEVPVYTQTEPVIGSTTQTVPGYSIPGPVGQSADYIPGVSGATELDVPTGTTQIPAATINVPTIQPSQTSLTGQKLITPNIDYITGKVIDPVPLPVDPAKVVGSVNVTPNIDLITGKPVVESPLSSMLTTVTPSQVVGEKTVTPYYFSANPKEVTFADLMDMYNLAGQKTSYVPGNSDVLSGLMKKVRKSVLEQAPDELKVLNKKYAQGKRATRIINKVTNKDLPESLVDKLARSSDRDKVATILDAAKEVSGVQGPELERAVAQKSFKLHSNDPISQLRNFARGVGLVGGAANYDNNPLLSGALFGATALTNPAFLSKVIPYSARYLPMAGTGMRKIITPWMQMEMGKQNE